MLALKADCSGFVGFQPLHGLSDELEWRLPVDERFDGGFHPVEDHPHFRGLGRHQVPFVLDHLSSFIDPEEKKII